MSLVVPVGRGELQTFEGLLSSCACEVLVEDDGVLRPRPSRSLGTSNPPKERQTVLQSRGTWVAGDRARTGRE